jgi:hypothetical protein
MEITIIKQHIEAGAHHFILSLHKEKANTRQTAVIIKKYVETGAITAEEETMLKLQLADTLKIVGIVIPFVLIPGASIVMPILIKVAGKHNINLLPSVLE